MSCKLFSKLKGVDWQESMGLKDLIRNRDSSERNKHDCIIGVSGEK